MKKQLHKKIILLVIIFALVFSTILTPLQIQAAGINLNWENPTAGRSPYKFNVSDIISGDLMVSVLGCTGIVNKVSGIIVNIFRPTQFKKDLEKMKKTIKDIGCFGVSMGLINATGTVPNTTISSAPKEGAERCKEVRQNNPELYDAAMEQLKIDETSKFREECLNGIAIALAKRQLTSITRSTMNWVASGFNGDPMYVRNINNYMNNITNRIIAEEIELFKGADPVYYPYGRSYARSLSSLSQIKDDVFGSLRLTLGNYLNFGNEFSDTYDSGYSDKYNSGYSDTYNYGIVERYANDFQSGGWDGWLAFTLLEENNPIGFNIKASDELAKKEEGKKEEAKIEHLANDGMLSQKRCVSTGITRESANRKANVEKAKKDEAEALTRYQNAQRAHEKDPSPKTESALSMAKASYEKARSVVLALGADGKEDYDEECKEWEIVTPGKIIGETVTNYLNSPVRQLELADTINESLAILFDSLLNKFKKEGLTSLGEKAGDFSNVSSGFIPNSVFDTRGNRITSNATSSKTLVGGGWNKSFDLTRDLGNTYIRDTENFKDLGDWNAHKNDPELLPGKGEINSFYTVSEPGRTKLIINGYNNWEKGDRAFFDGENWQNWRKATPGQSIDLPIDKRGVLQIQQDYIASAMDMLTLLPSVMPKIGELDYCIPGPNPSWQANSFEAQDAFNSFVNGVQTNYLTGEGWFERDYVIISAPAYNSSEYRNYKSIFDGTDLWQPGYTGDNQKNGDPRKSSNVGQAGYVQGTEPWKLIFAPRNYDLKSGGGIIYQKTSSNSWPEWRGDKGISSANNLVNETRMTILTLLEKFNKEYVSLYEENYGKKSEMQTELILNEKYEVSTPNNTSFLPMAAEGHSITRDILSYDEKIRELTEEAKEAIVITKSNILKLDEIKKEVSYIINEAQKRRTANNAEIIKKIMEERKISEAEAKALYATCSKEEEIYYIDANDLMRLNKKEDRCFDSLDNDLDGYIDINDSDCNLSGVNIDIGLNINGQKDLASFGGGYGGGYYSNDLNYNEGDWGDRNEEAWKATTQEADR